MLEKKAARKIFFPDLLSVPQPPPFAQSLILEKPLQSGNKAAAMFQCCLLCPSRFRFCRFRPEKEVFFFCHFAPLFGLVCTEYEKEGEAGNLQSIFARFEPIFAHFQHVSYEDSSFFGACPNGAFRVPRRSLESPPMIPPLHSRSTWALFRLRRPLFLSSFPIGTFNVNSDPTSSQPRHSSRF